MAPRVAAWTAVLAGAAFAAAQAQDAAPAEAKPKWEKSATLGFTLTQGNSDTMLATATLLGATKWGQNELSLGADGAYGEVDDTRNAASAHGFGQYNRLFSERLYGYGRADVLHDAIADVEYRVTLSPGLGYYFIKNDRCKLAGEVGPGFIAEKLGHDEDQYFTLRVAERFEYKLSETARIWQSLEWIPEVGDFENYLLTAEVGVEADITPKLALSVVLRDNYDSEPAPGRKENDLRLISGLKYKF